MEPVATMKAIVVVVAVLFALWVVGRIGVRHAAFPRQAATVHAIEVASTDTGEASISAEAATQAPPWARYRHSAGFH